MSATHDLRYSHAHGSAWGAFGGTGKSTTSAPLVRVSSPDEISVNHRRVWLYGNDRGVS